MPRSDREAKFAAVDDVFDGFVVVSTDMFDGFVPVVFVVAFVLDSDSVDALDGGSEDFEV